MTLNALTSGQRVLFTTRLNDTANHTICMAAQQAALTIESFFIAQGTNGSTTLDLWINDGTNNTYLMKAVPLTTNSTIRINDQHIPLKAGWSLLAKASVANKVDIVTVAIQSNPTQNMK